MEGICEALTDELNELQQQIHLKNQLLKQKQQQQQQGKRRTIQHNQVQSAQHGLFEFCRVLLQIPWAHVCYERFPPSFKNSSWKLVKLKVANMCTQSNIHCLHDHFNVWTTLTLLHLNILLQKVPVPILAKQIELWLSQKVVFLFVSFNLVSRAFVTLDKRNGQWMLWKDFSLHSGHLVWARKCKSNCVKAAKQWGDWRGNNNMIYYLSAKFYFTLQLYFDFCHAIVNYTLVAWMTIIDNVAEKYY